MAPAARYTTVTLPLHYHAAAAARHVAHLRLRLRWQAVAALVGRYIAVTLPLHCRWPANTAMRAAMAALLHRVCRAACAGYTVACGNSSHLAMGSQKKYRGPWAEGHGLWPWAVAMSHGLWPWAVVTLDTKEVADSNRVGTSRCLDLDVTVM